MDERLYRREGAGRVAVVIATRDRRASVLATLSRLRDLPERPHVIVVDNASADGTPDAVAQRFPGVELVAMKENLGSAARNVGIERAATPYVALCDDDSWWAPGALAAAARAFDAYPQLGLVAARVLVGHDHRLDPTCVEMASSPLRAPMDLPGPFVLGFVACGAVVRRDAFLAVGGFPARFGVGGEEEMLAIDLAEGGWGLAYVEEVVAHHHPSPRRDPGARTRVVVRNALWAAWLRRRFPGAMRRTASIARAGVRDAAARGGLVDATRGLTWVVRERRPVSEELEGALRVIAG